MIKEKEEEINAESLGLKLDSNKSMFAKKAKPAPTFEDQAKGVHTIAEERKIKGFELSQKFLGVFQNKTLPANKGPIEKNLEKEVIKDLVQFAIELNNDHNEKEGIGSVGMITLIFNCLLKMRDGYNAIEYKLVEAESEIARLEKLLEQSDGKVK